jgi:cytochrome P450
MKLAYAEMRLMLARLLWNFDIALANERDRWDWGVQKTYVLWVSVYMCELRDVC